MFADVITSLSTKTRRLLVKRGGASPTPPPVEAEGKPPASPVEAPPPPKTKQPAPTVEAAVDDAPPWLMKALVTIASVPTLLALPLAAWSVAQVLPVPDVVALPIGILFDVAMVASVLIALLVPRFARSATLVGWVAAVLAAAAIVAHAGLSVAALFAAAPLVSKLLWGMVVQIRTEQARARQREAERLQKKAAEEARKAAELSTDLTFEQQEEIARLEREALYEEKLAAARLKVKLAKSEAEHLEALAEIERIGDQRVAENEQSARVWAQEIRLNQKLRAMAGQKPAFLSIGRAEGTGSPVAPAVGAAATNQGPIQEFGFSRPLDVEALTPKGAAVSFDELPEEHQQLVRYVHVEKKPTIRGAALEFDCDPRTVRRWKEKLAEVGYSLPIGK